MKVFISWSGNQSKTVAEHFRQWLPAVLQAVQPYFTPDDITKGTRWNTEITQELEESSIGLLFMTSENLESKWLMFEAGALSKNLDKSKVIPILLGIETTDIEGPLVQFQSARFDKLDIKRVLKSINSELGDQALTDEVLDSVFEMWWPKLEEKCKTVLTSSKPSRSEKIRSERDLLEEVLATTRSIAKSSTMSGRRIQPRAGKDLVNRFRELIQMCINDDASLNILTLISSMEPPTMHILRSINPESAETFGSVIQALDNHIETRIDDVEPLEDDLPF
jgi:hypothetical protein